MQFEARKIRATALYTQLQATATVAAASGAVAQVKILAQAAVAAMTAAINAPAIALGVQAQLIQISALTGQFLKVMILDDQAQFSDQIVMRISRALEDAARVSEQIAITTGKAAQDSSELTDQTLVEVRKALSDAVGISDVKVLSVGKVLQEAASASDLIAKSVQTVKVDAIQYREGPGIDDYAIGYFAEDYAYDGKPAYALIKPRSDSASVTDLLENIQFGKNASETIELSETLSRFIQKSLTDTVGVTDDFYGVANIDDEQVMTMMKGVSDAFVVGDTFVRVVYFVRDFSDSASLSDATVLSVGKGLQDATDITDLAAIATAKPLSDATSVTDDAVKTVSKSFSDSASLTDAATKSANKALSDSASLTDATAFAVSKQLADSASVTDLKAFSLSRSTADSASASDTVIKTVAPSKADAASLTDSGVARMQSYCDITYFAEDYVGIQFTF